MSDVDDDGLPKSPQEPLPKPRKDDSGQKPGRKPIGLPDEFEVEEEPSTAAHEPDCEDGGGGSGHGGDDW